MDYNNTHKRVIVKLHPRFRRAESRSALLPINEDFSPFGYVSNRAYCQALSIAPFMVELFTVDGLSTDPQVDSASGTDCHQSSGSPRQRRLSGPFWARTPWMGFAAFTAHPFGPPRPLPRCPLEGQGRPCKIEQLRGSGFSPSPSFNGYEADLHPVAAYWIELTDWLHVGITAAKVYS